MKTLVVFGAEDPEQIVAEKVAIEAGCTVAVALSPGPGRVRVHAGNAYTPGNWIRPTRWKEVRLDPEPSNSEELLAGFVTWVRTAFGRTINDAPFERIILFETCLWYNGRPLTLEEATALYRIPVLLCDHHNVGDPGYDKGPAEFWMGSSLGQLVDLLDYEVECEFVATDGHILGRTAEGIPGQKSGFYSRATGELALIAASDHCPADAYAGRCPGITAAEFRAFRVQRKVTLYAENPASRPAYIADRIEELTQAGWPGAQLIDIERSVEDAIASAGNTLLSAPAINGGRLPDLRGMGIIPELPEAALRIGYAYIADAPSVEPGTTKIVLGGHTNPADVETFINAANAGEFGIPVSPAYGNPTRGYAGVVVHTEA